MKAQIVVPLAMAGALLALARKRAIRRAKAPKLAAPFRVGDRVVVEAGASGRKGEDGHIVDVTPRTVPVDYLVAFPGPDGPELQPWAHDDLSKHPHQLSAEELARRNARFHKKPGEP